MQIYLDEELNRKLAAFSYRLGTSKASLVREGVRLLLKEEGTIRDEPLMSLRKAAGRSGRKDVSWRHDAALAKLQRKHAA
ncbi:MAG: ribbon-helix-helix domain-containing protein [Elusimicrobia bacterium]|nr:ribbon-helix-helix domain-containing protein [Elusimicrobiota bacterium]